MILAVVHTITPDLIKSFKKKKVNSIVYLEIEAEVNTEYLSQDFRLIYGFENLPEINNVSFDLVRERLLNLSYNIPGIFKYKGYDLLEGLAKDIFWGLYENNAILYQVNKCKVKGVEKLYDYYSRTPLVKNLALLKKLFYGKNLLYSFNINDSQVKITAATTAFRINEFEMLEMYGDLISNLKDEEIISFQNILRSNADEIHTNLNKIFKLNYRCTLRLVSKNTISFTHRLRLFFSKFDADFLNVTADAIYKLINHVDEYERLASYGIRRFFVAAAENEGEGNVLCQVARKYKGVTYNYMNGAKGKEHNNIHSDFTYWFMPDESTQKLILSYCNVTAHQVPVTGHLLEEKAKNYNYRGTLNNFSKLFESKKIIALFSSPIHKKEQMEVVGYLNNYLDKNDDTVVLIRKHPFDHRTWISSHKRMVILPAFEGELYNLSLFDLFFKSSLTISFSSTVSLQSTWFGLPTLNVEFATTSLLPYVDNKKIMHVDSMDRLATLLETYLKNEKELKSSHEFVPVSSNIIKILKAPLLD